RGTLMNTFQLENLDRVEVITPGADAPNLTEVRLHGEAQTVFESLRGSRPPAVIVDLARVPAFGSAFISVLIRMHKIVRQGGGEMVLAGASQRASEVLYLTGLDRLWPSYENRERAMQAVVDLEGTAAAGTSECTP